VWCVCVCDVCVCVWCVCVVCVVCVCVCGVWVCVCVCGVWCVRTCGTAAALRAARDLPDIMQTAALVSGSCAT
jgi:hypothetical protein